VGDGGTQAFASNCALDLWNPNGATSPVAYQTQGGATDFTIYACATVASNAAGMSIVVYGLVTGPGTFSTSVQYTDPTGKGWAGPGTLVLTKVGSVGDTVEGTFTGMLTLPATQAFEATITACRIPDDDGP
jgi:hypothetical protein